MSLSKFKLKHPPLVVVTADVKFATVSEFNFHSDAVVKAMTNAGYPISNVIDDDHEKQVGRFSDTEGTKAIVVRPGGMTILSSRYGNGFEGFGTQIETALGISSKTFAEGLICDEIRLRKVNAFEIGNEPEIWLKSGVLGVRPEDIGDDAHQHHYYRYWTDNPESGNLMISVESSHGNQLLPSDLYDLCKNLSFNVSFDPQYEVTIAKIDLCVSSKDGYSFQVEDTESLLKQFSEFSSILNTGFLACVTKEALGKWGIKQL